MFISGHMRRGAELNAITNEIYVKAIKRSDLVPNFKSVLDLWVLEHHRHVSKHRLILIDCICVNYK